MHHGAAATLAYAHRNSNGKVLDKWILKCQGATPFVAIEQKQVRLF